MAEILCKTNVLYNNFHHQIQQPDHSKLTPVSLRPSSIIRSSSSFSGFCDRRVVIGRPIAHKATAGACNSQMSIGLKKAQGWWEKGLKTNMKEVQGPEDLVESLLNAGDQLVVVDFFSPGCGGCRALHPKICQFVEMNPDVLFLQVNYEEHKSMCYSLNVHVLPFFRFYRGAHGRLCSFSCTNATIKKFKDALAKHSPDRCSLGPTKGLEEKELIALAANRDLSFTYKPKPEHPLAVPDQEKILQAPLQTSNRNTSPPLPLPLPLPRPLEPATMSHTVNGTDNKTLITSAR